MDYSREFTKIKELITSANSILILTHEKPTFDSMGSALALSLGLQSIGKQVTVACPDPVTVELSGFVGIDKVINEVSKKNFIISLNYVDGSIEKVSYNIEGNTFNLVIEPRPGFEPFSSEKVHFAHSGVQADVLIVIDTIHFGGLKKLYESDKDLFSTKPVINIDRHPNNSHFGQINIVDTMAAATAELVAQVLSAMGVRLTQDIATNILNALYTYTDNFQSPYVSGRTFELAAACVKSGAKRFQKQAPGEELPIAQIPVQPAEPDTIQSVSDQKLQTAQEPRVQPAKKPSNKPQETPADWLKPKIFKSSNVL